MKLTDLIEALAEEIDLMQPQLEETLDQLSGLSLEDENFQLLLDQYNDYAFRMGEASEMVGFTGLQVVCQKVQDNTLLLANYQPAERHSILEFLRKWPILISAYLREIDDPSVAAGLMDLFIDAPAPFADDEAMKVMHQLGTMALKASEGANFQDKDNIRPTEASIDDVSLDVPVDIDQDLINGFLQESPEMALNLVNWAQAVAAGGQIDIEGIKTAKRFVHTLKGTGATVGIRGLASIGHHYEDILEYLEDKPEDLQYLADIVLDSAYCMEQMVGYIAEVDDYPEQSLMVLQQLLDTANRIDNKDDLSAMSEVDREVVNNRVLDSVSIDAVDFMDNQINAQNSIKNFNNTLVYSVDDSMSSNNFSVQDLQNSQVYSATVHSNSSDVPPDNLVEHSDNKTIKNKLSTPIKKEAKSAKSTNTALRVPLEKIDELFRVSGEISIHTSAMEDKIKSLTEQSKQLLEQNIRVQKRLFELETLVDVRALSMMRGRISEVDDKKGFDPLEMDQYNELHSSAHALVEESADSREVAMKIEEEIASLSSMQSRQQVLSRDLQHLIIGTRMSEVGVLEARLQRNVRTSSQMTGKQVTLIMTGQDTLIDSDVLNKMSEPLLHLLRNAVDHGIEDLEEREAKGKSPIGKIYLDFFRQGQQVILRCEDDGCGLDINKIHTRAVDKGLITDYQELSFDEIAQLIMTSGFSSRDTVSQLSGRGVGLDVVRDWVNNMNGSVYVTKGQYGGCLFELRFAASLSTMQSLLVKVAEAIYALPAVQVEQAVPRSVGVFDYVNEQLTYHYNNQMIPARFLADLTGTRGSTLPLSEYDAVIVSINNNRYVLAVNELIDARELLVKPPGRYAQHLDGVSGLSILGNGAIAVNLDLTQIIDSKAKMHKLEKQTADNLIESVPNVLIVDDALTVRNSLKQLVDDIGYNSKTARDGMEAANLLNEFEPDIVLTDLEMPNMNGIELTQFIRHKDDLHELPIIMITSRSQDKHRQLAKTAGVDQYITKPYQDIELLQAIKTHLS